MWCASSKKPSYSVRQPFNFYLRLGCDRQAQTFVSQQYTAYPFRLSRTFRLDAENPDRAYLYLMNSSPGLFAGDQLHLGIQLDPTAQVYLTDQAATKVHTMPVPGSLAQVMYQIEVASGASLEFVPEPLILYADASLEQSIEVTLHPTGQLFLSEIVIPGRLARTEYYQFRHYFSRLRVLSPDRELIFADAMRLEGKANPFKDSLFFAPFPILATIAIVFPAIDRDQLSNQLTSAATANSSVRVGVSPLPNCSGLWVRLMGKDVNDIKTYIRLALNRARQMNGQPALPEIPK